MKQGRQGLTDKQIAYLLSELFNPLFVALPTLLAVAFARAPDSQYALLWWVVAVGGISVAPALFIWRGVARGRYTDHHVSVREQRLIPLLFGITSMSVAFLFLWILQVSRAFLATVLAVIIACGIALLVTRYWKISLHLVGTAGAVTVCVLLFGPFWFVLSPLIAVVAWARWRVGAHTLLQACAGALLAITVTVCLFRLLGVV